MFQKIVLAHNGGEEMRPVLEIAADLARLYSAELNLIGIVANMPSTAMADPYPQSDFVTAGRNRIEQVLLSETDQLRTRGINVAFKVLEGSPPDEIAAYANQIKADLVVIGHADKVPIARWFEGSTGAKLLRDLPCSLLIATEN